MPVKFTLRAGAKEMPGGPWRRSGGRGPGGGAAGAREPGGGARGAVMRDPAAKETRAIAQSVHRLEVQWLRVFARDRWFVFMGLFFLRVLQRRRSQACAGFKRRVSYKQL